MKPSEKIARVICQRNRNLEECGGEDCPNITICSLWRPYQKEALGMSDIITAAGYNVILRDD